MGLLVMAGAVGFAVARRQAYTASSRRKLPHVRKIKKGRKCSNYQKVARDAEMEGDNDIL